MSFYRTTGRAVIRIRTDWDTTEKVVLRYAKGHDLTEWFLLRGEPFRQSDWAKIESARNRLKPNMRANIWVCDDGSNPIVDWQPPGTN